MAWPLGCNTALRCLKKPPPCASTVLLVTVITFITIVFGELVPKRVGQLYPEAVARVVARPMTWVAISAKPFVRLLALCTQATLLLLRVDTSNQRGRDRRGDIGQPGGGGGCRHHRGA